MQFDFLTETKDVPALLELMNKVLFLLHPERFKILFPYCFWYWAMCTILLLVLIKYLKK